MVGYEVEVVMYILKTSVTPMPNISFKCWCVMSVVKAKLQVV